MEPVSAAAEPFFLATASGQRFCVFHPPQGHYAGAVLAVPPFGDEMNKSRRMAALQARSLAARGFGVLRLDLEGCGDSEGDLRDARWLGWKDDLAAGAAWLSARLGAPLSLLGLRTGALLALDFARGRSDIGAIVLWQPVASGEVFLTHLLRLKLAGGMLGDGAASASTAALRAALAAGETLEIGGYEISGALAQDLGAQDLRTLTPGQPVHWFEVAADGERPISPGSARIIDAWRAAGVAIESATVAGPAFWATQEISESAALIEATCSAFEGKRG